MSNIQYFYEDDSLFKISMNIKEVCSANAIYKRSIKDIEMIIFSKNKKLISIHFDEGFWMPSQSKFFLRSNKTMVEGCFGGTNSLTVNLKTNVVNSIKGHYLNLESGKKHKMNCNSLDKT